MTMMSKLATGKNDRKQEILTPKPITDFVRLVFGGPIMLDPCSPVGGTPNVQALDWMSGPDAPGRDGLKEPWQDATFCNPPFGKLKDWLAKAVDEAEALCQSVGGPAERQRIVVLCPNRTNRPWFRKARDLAKRTGFVLELNPVTFVGCTGTFPVPCVLLAFNVPQSCLLRWPWPIYTVGCELGGFL
jgi:hypothetical protein